MWLTRIIDRAGTELVCWLRQIKFKRLASDEFPGSFERGHVSEQGQHAFTCGSQLNASSEKLPELDLSLSTCMTTTARHVYMLSLPT